MKIVQGLKKTFKQIDLEKSFNKVLSSLKIDKNTEITHDKLPKVISDSDQIIKVFQSLIISAIDFKKEDKLLKIHISVRKDNENGEYVFSVQDNGTGIDPRWTESIFTRYYHQEHYHVTAVSLSATKKIIEEHGGNIWVQSEPNVGSTFYFTLPINPESPSKILKNLSNL